MSKPIDDGGAAFPQSAFLNANNEVACAGHYFSEVNGMTLRDWFAGQALAGLVGKAAFDQPAEDMMHRNGVKTEEFEAFISLIAYDFADAMIAQRAKPREAAP